MVTMSHNYTQMTEEELRYEIAAIHARGKSAQERTAALKDVPFAIAFYYCMILRDFSSPIRRLIAPLTGPSSTVLEVFEEFGAPLGHNRDQCFRCVSAQNLPTRIDLPMRFGPNRVREWEKSNGRHGLPLRLRRRRRRGR